MNEDDVREKLVEEIGREVDNLISLEPGTEQHTAAVEALNMLYRLNVDNLKVLYDDDVRRLELENKQAEQELEKLRLQQEAARQEVEVREAKKDRIVKTGTAIFEVVAPIVAYSAMFGRGLEFEQTGTVTSSFMRSLVNKLPWKK